MASAQARVQANYVAYVVRLAMIEFLCMAGFVVSLLSQLNYILPFAALSIIGFIMTFPRSDKTIKPGPPKAFR